MTGISGVSSFPSAVQSSTQGITRALNGLDRSAQTVASANVSGGIGMDVTTAMVDSLQQKLMVQLSVEMLKTAHEALGSLLDVRA